MKDNKPNTKSKSMNYQLELTILMPCLNEEETIGTCILKAQNAIKERGIMAEVLIADNGSTDASIEIAQNLGAQVIHVKERGYGSALIAGINHAKGKYIIMGDADDSYDFGDIYKFVKKLRNGFDLVMGNRFKGGVEKGAMPYLHRYLGNPVLSFIGRLFFRSPIKDFHCGLRGFNRDAILELGLCTTGMEFASEMVVKSALNKLNISEVPIKLYPDGRTRAPHLRTWHDGWRHLRFLLLYSPKWLFLYPGLFMFFIGLILSTILFGGPVNIGSVTFDIHSMLYFSMLIVVGFQVVAFYFQSKVFAIKTDLLKEPLWLKRFEKVFSLEKGLLIGLLLILIGVVLSVSSFLMWDKSAFGNLEPSKVFRVVIPAVTFLIIGGQSMFNSFFMSLLGLKTNKSNYLKNKNKPEDAPEKVVSIN